MATQLFLLSTVADTHRGNNDLRLGGGFSGLAPKATGTARGSGVVGSGAVATATGPTAGLEVTTTAIVLEWITPPLAADITISGAITKNLWMSESNMSANVGPQVVIERINSQGVIVSTIANHESGVELAVTTRAVNNWATGTVTSTNMLRGDRIRIVVAGNDAGTMATGFTFDLGYNGTSAAADGDSYVTFTENLTFETTDPTGTTLYLTDTASAVATASVDREMWTSRGAGVVNDVTNTAAGWTAPIQATDTAGGTVVDWFSKPLTAFTLGGKALVNVRANQSNIAARATIGVEIARVDNDGTNPSVWGAARKNGAANTVNGDIATTETAYTVYVAGDALAVSDGQRLRLRLFVDDSCQTQLVTGHTVTTYYAGTSGGASGDTFVTLPQSVTEYVAPVFAHLVMAPHRAP